MQSGGMRLMFDNWGFRAQFIQFIGFSFWSGLGWLCDFASFTLLVKVFDTPEFMANFTSSYLGVTFVWFTSLKRVFGRTGESRGRFLFSYWGFQFVSILAYSQLLHLIAGVMTIELMASIINHAKIAAKIIVTPSQLLYLGTVAVMAAELQAAIISNTEIAAKIIVTPFNLVTNFLFMKFLTRYMRNARSAYA